MHSTKKTYIRLFSPFALIATLLLLFGCTKHPTGYTVYEGKLVWQWYHGGNMRMEYKPIEGVDPATFRQLVPNVYAVDKDHVYFKHRRIKGADPATFHIIDLENGYTADAKHVYLDYLMIPKADPQSFRVIAYPFSADAKHIFNGTLPIDGLPVSEADSICQVPDKSGLHPSLSWTQIDEFIRRNPHYAYLRRYPIDGVIKLYRPQYIRTTHYVITSGFRVSVIPVAHYPRPLPVCKKKP